MKGEFILQTETKIISVVNQKGGVGKTTTAWNVGIGLAKSGYKVLLLDFDPQGDLTTCLGWKNNEELENTVSSLLLNKINNRESNMDDFILHNDEGVDLIPSNLDLASTEMQLISAFNRESLLKNSIEPIKNNYDYIVIDCPPALGILTINALATSTDVLIPVQTHYLPAKGMTKLMGTINMVKRAINPKLNVMGICMTLCQERTNVAKSSIEAVTQGYGKHVKIFNNIIPYAIGVSETSIVAESLYKYDGDGKASKAYEGLTKEIIKATQPKNKEYSR